ncbi:MAG: hypothetical protein J6O53_07380 [Eubacterium sp.]|nr:hypothetical protein [Eubacterium sp.]
MDIWTILKIEPTRDKEQLKKAYRKVLVTVHPEDDPEGFQALRAAYEEALRLADLPEEEYQPEAGPKAQENREPAEIVYPDTPQGRMQKTMQEIYASFFRRVDVHEWEALLEEPYASSIDTSTEAMYTLLDFITGHYLLPHQVYKFLTEHYDLSEQREELTARYPSRFVDYILANGRYADAVDFTKFTGPADYDYDHLIEAASAFSRALRAENIPELMKLLPKLKDLPVRNPDIDIMLVRFLWQTDREEEAEELLEELNRLYPEDVTVLINTGDIKLHSEDLDGAERCYRKAEEISGDSRVIRGRLGEVANAREDFEKARDIFYDLMQDDPYENYYRAQVHTACEGIVKKKKAELEADPGSLELRIALATALYQSYQFEEGIRVLTEIDPPKGLLGATYHNYLGRCLLSIRKPVEAEAELRLWIDAIVAIPEADESDEATAIRKRMGYAVTLLGVALMQQKRYAEARTAIDSALSMRHDEYAVTMEEKCVLEYLSGNYAEGIRACVELEKRSPMNYQASNIRAKCSYEMDLFQDAAEYANRAIGIFPFYAEPYLIMAKIALRQKNYDGAEGVAARLKQMVPESDTASVIRARVLLERDGSRKEALRLLKPVKANIEKNESDVEERDRFYLMLGDIYKEMEEPHKALEEYQLAEKENPENAVVLERLGDMHRRLLHYQEALECFDRQSELVTSDRVLLNQGYCLMQLGRYFEARKKTLIAARLMAPGSRAAIVAGRLLLAMGCPRDGLKVLSGLGEPAPEEYDPDLLELRLKCMLRLKMYGPADKLITALRETRAYQSVRLLHAQLLVLSGRFGEAEQMLLRTDWRRDEMQGMHDRLCECFFYAGKLKELKAAVKTAEQNEPAGPGGKLISGYQYELLGRLQLLHKEYKAAEESFRLAMDRDPGKRFRYQGFMAECASRQFNGKTRVNRYISVLEQMGSSGLFLWESKIRLAQSLRAGKDYARAESLLREVLDVLPWDGEVNALVSEAYEELGWLHLARKDKSQALLSFEQAGAARGVDLVLKDMIMRLQNDCRN